MGFRLEIVTPDRAFFSDEVDMVILRGIDGDFAVLKNRSPIITPLSIGKIIIKKEGKEKIAAIAGGYVSVTEGKTTVITDSAEWPEEIDIERAKRAKERAERRLKGKDEKTDLGRAKSSLRRALNRLDVLNYIKNNNEKISH